MTEPTHLRILILYALGFLVRFIFLKSPSLTEILTNRVEISTPISSWKRAIEGVNLWKQGIDPYEGDIFHESPLGLVIYNFLLTNVADWLPMIFAACDVLTAVFLSFIAKIYLKNIHTEEKNAKFDSSAEPLILKVEHIKWVPFYVASVYILCPYAIASCGGKSTVIFQNMFLALFMLFTVAGKWFLATVLLALLSCHSFYHVALLVPLLMYTQKIKTCKKKYSDIFRLFVMVATFVVSISLVFVSFLKITKSFNFIWSTYGCILSVPDLTPNVGLFWYFFTEMFEHFRVFFLCTFQLNVFIYTTPLAVRLRKEPFFILFIHLIIIAIFKSYPCIGDVALYLALIPVWSHLIHFMRQRFIVCCILASSTLLAPTLWHLWIYSGSANANFYFAITLAFNTGQVFLLTDILSAYVKREYYLENGVKYNEDGTLGLLRLQ